MRKVSFIDTTLRDAQQSLWSTRMTTAMMLPVAPILDRLGFEAIDLVGGAVFDVCVRYLLEDPWERMRIMSGVITRTPLIVMTRGQSLFTFEFFPDDVVELTAKRIAANGIRYTTPYDGLNDLRNLHVPVRAAKTAGLFVAAGLVYTVSPVHTDAYYAAKARELVRLGVDAVFLKDPSGLLKPERIHTLIPVLRSAVGALPLQLHTHCLTGLGPICALNAVGLGVDTVHTATSVLAHGASQPPTEWLARNLKRMGFKTGLDVEGLQAVADHFRYVAKREGKPLGTIAEYDPFHYEHQIPGGMISNLRSQLRDIGLEHRLEEILEESARVRQELGYPIMVSPFSQFVVTQAVLNLVQRERYATVPDEIRKYALGYYGQLAAPLDPNVLDRVIGNEDPVTARPGELLAPALERVRRERGPFASDDDLLLAVFYNPKQYANLVAARPIKTHYSVGRTPLVILTQELAVRRDIAQVTLIKTPSSERANRMETVGRKRMREGTVILSGARTPIGKFGGSRRPLTAGALGAHAIRKTLVRTGYPLTASVCASLAPPARPGTARAPDA